MNGRSDNISELHNGSVNGHIFVPKEGQGGSLCSNKEPLPCPSLGADIDLSKDTVEALEELGEALKGIRKRMIAEGYEIKNGIVQKINEQTKSHN